jgi:hypothetical protein
MATIALVLAAGLQLALPSGVNLPTRPRAPAAAPASAVNIHVAPTAYAAIMAHPIFAPDRAPPAAEAEASGNLSGYEVLGTAIAGKVAAAALLRDSGGEITRIKVGEVIDGWKLLSIAPEELVFDRNGERRSLTVDITAPTRTGPGGAAGSAKRGGAAATASNDNSDASDNSDDSDDSDDDQ